MSGSALNLQLCSASMLSTTILLHLSHAGVLPSATADGASHCDVIAIDLDILVHEQHDVFGDRQVHRHLINHIHSYTLNNVFDSALLEVIILVLMRYKQTSMMPGDIETLMVRNFSVKKQNKLED